MACSVEAGGAEMAYTLTSGHLSPAELRAFAAAICPKVTVSVRGVKWDEESPGFGTIRRLADAEPMVDLTLFRGRAWLRCRA